MNIKVGNVPCHKIACDLLVLGVFEGPKKTLDNLLKNQNFEGKKGEGLLVFTQGKLEAEKVYFIGLGAAKEANRDTVRNAMAQGIKKAVELKAKNIAFHIDPTSIPASDLFQSISEGVILGSYKFPGIHKKPKEHFVPSTVIVLLQDKSQMKDALGGIRIGSVLAQAENRARDLVNSPSNKITPEFLANYSKKMAKEHKLKCEILDPKKEGMECLWSVAKGSRNPPKVVVLKYHGGKNKSKEVIGLVGKGITFDSGGISIKPSSRMWEMRGDMAGAASVIEAMRAISELKIQKNMIAVIPIAENMPDGAAAKPGDVVGSLDGTTVEIISTDAEGRMILADAITYIKGEGAAKLFDCATLTGGCITALGDAASGLLGNNQEFIDQIIDASERSGQKVWHLPIFEEYKDYLKSNIADIKNCMDKGMASASTGAVFLQKFVGDDLPWVHLDIAGTYHLDKPRGPYIEGATGVPTRTILEWLLVI